LAPIWEVGLADGQVLRTTQEHPFWVENRREWRAVYELREGDLLRTEDRRLVAVSSVRDTGVWERVYNWEVEEYHTYFVSATADGASVWSHNIGRCGEGEDLNGLTRVSGGRAQRSFRNPQRYLDANVDSHHPFFRTFLRAMGLSGQYPQARTRSGKMRGQSLEYMDPADHRQLHQDWNEFVVGQGRPELQVGRGSSRRIAAALANGRITGRDLFNLMRQFYAGRPDSASFFGLQSVRSLGRRMGIQGDQPGLPFPPF
jgi:hypothetical protein